MAGLKFLIKGDDSPIRKTLEKLKKDVANNEKAAVQSTIAATDTTKKKQKEVLDTINAQTKAIKERNKEDEKVSKKRAPKPAPASQPAAASKLSNSRSEVDAYQASKVGAPNMTGPLVAPRSQQDLINQFKQLDVEQTKLTANYKAGKISADTYAKTIDALSKKQAELRTAIQDYNKGQDAAAAATAKANGATKTQIGLLDRLNGKLKTYKEQRPGLLDVDQLSKANKKIQETEQEIARLNNIGRIGFDELGNKIEGTTGKIDRLKRISAGYRLMADSSDDFKQITVFNAKAQQAADEAQRLSNVGKKGFDEMGNKIKTSGGFLNGMWGGLKQVANILPGVGIAGLLAFAVEPIINYLSKLDLFSEKISETVKRKKELARAMLQGAQNAQGELTTLKLLYAQYQNNNLPLKKRKEAYEELQKLYPDYFGNLKFEQTAAGKTKASYDQLTTSILATARARAAADKMTQNSSRILDNETKTNELREERIKLEAKLREQEAKVPKRDNRQVGASGLGVTVTDNRAEQEFLKTRDKIREIDEQIRNHRTDTNILTQRNLDLEKQVTKEVEKGAKISGAVGGEVDKIPKAKKRAEKKIKDLTYQKETEELKIRLEREKQLYEDYENYKVQFGADAAKERYGKELDLTQSYLDRVKKLAVMNMSATLGVVGTERNEYLAKEVQQATDAEAKKSEAVLAEFMTYATKRRVTLEGYLAKEAALRKDGHNAEADEAREAGRKAIAEMDDLNSQKLKEFEKLLDGIDRLSAKEARKSIAAAKSLLDQKVKEGKISVERAKEILQLLNSADEAVSQRIPDGLINVANQMDRIADAVGDVDSGFANVLRLAAGVTGELGNAFRTAAAFKNATSIGDKLSAGMGMVGAGLAIVKTVNTFLDRQTKADKDREESRARELKSTEALTKALERQLSVAERAYGTKKIEEYRKAIEEANKTIEDGEQSLKGRNILTGDKELDALITKVNNGEKLKKWAWWGDSEKEVYDMMKKHLTGVTTDVEELQRLLDNGLLDANTAVIAQNFINATEAIEEAKNAIAEFNTGTSFNAMADSIVDLFATGNAAAEDFGKNFEDIMKKAILNSFKTQTLATQLKDFYNNFADFADSDGKLTESEIAALRAEYDKIIKESQERFAELEKVTGVSFESPDGEDSANSYQGAYKTASQESINLLAGNTAGLRIATIETNRTLSTHTPILQQQLQIAMQGIQYQQQIAANTLRTADNTNRLQAIEGSLASINRTLTSNSNSAQAAGFRP